MKRYNQAVFNSEDRKNKLQKIVGSISDADFDGLKIHQNAQIYRIDLDENSSFTYQLKSKNHGVYVMNISGVVEVEEEVLKVRDVFGISKTKDFTINATIKSELLFIEVLV